MHKPTPPASRREFVKDFALTSAALAFGLNFSSTVSAEPAATTDLAWKLELQVTPSPDESSGVICKQAGATYLIFDAIQIDEEDRQIEGTRAGR